MNQPLTLPPLTIFSKILHSLLVVVANRVNLRMNDRLVETIIPVPLANRVIARIRRFEREFLALAARIRAGTLRSYPNRRKPAPLRAPRARAPSQLPRGFGWLCVVAPYEAGPFGGQLAHLMNTDPDMAALCAATPRVAALLRPIYRALAIDKSMLPKSAPPAPSATQPAHAGTPQPPSHTPQIVLEQPPPQPADPPGFHKPVPG